MITIEQLLEAIDKTIKLNGEDATIKLTTLKELIKETNK
jgi:hypothetical protein